MFGLAASAVAVVALARAVAAQDGDSVTVTTKTHGSVIFTRTGERTPFMLDDGSQVLTPLGANQLFAVGTMFRNRYIPSNNTTSSNSNTTTGLRTNPIDGLSPSILSNSQVYALTTDEQYTIGSAQAFIQGFYPGAKLSTATSEFFNGIGIVNGTLLDYPLNNYQYAQIHAVSDMDPNSIYVAGSRECPAYSAKKIDYYNSGEFKWAQKEASGVYKTIGPELLADVMAPSQWDYSNAYLISDYLNFQYLHNKTAKDLFDSDPAFQGKLQNLQWYADQQQWAFNGIANDNHDSIQTIAGQTLAAKVLGALYGVISGAGASNKVSLMFGDLEPFLAFFALTRLEQRNSNFYGIPQFGSSMVFELYSVHRSDEPATNSFPTSDDLWVTFYFRNGSSTDRDLQSFPLFGRGPSETNMRWVDFELEMRKLITDATISSWCNACLAESLFCAAFESSFWVNGGFGRNKGHSASALSPAAAGAVGAVVTLAVLALAALALIFLGGFRIARRHNNTSSSSSTPKSPSFFFGEKRKRTSSLGGFKGSAKLTSDVDVSFPKAAAVIAGTEKRPHHTHERVGSWEMNDKAGRKDFGNSAMHRDTEVDDDDFAVNPFADPMKPRETV